MAGSVPQTWSARIIKTRPVRTHEYEDRDGVRTCVGIKPMVQIVLAIEGGRENGREVIVEVDPEEAFRQSNHLRNSSVASTGDSNAI